MRFGLEPHVGIGLVHRVGHSKLRTQAQVPAARVIREHPYPKSPRTDCYVDGTMDKLDPSKGGKHEAGAADLARRLARYRRRVEAEGRQRSVRMIDRAIEERRQRGVRKNT